MKKNKTWKLYKFQKKLCKQKKIRFGKFGIEYSVIFNSKNILVMNKKGPIVIIEENEEDRKLFAEIFSDLKLTNKMFCFNSCIEAYHYLISKRIKPFLLFSNIVFQGGEEQSFYNKHKSLCLEFRCPCLFFTTLFNQCFIIDTYSMPTHSYFVKPYSFEKFKHVVQSVIQYWSKGESMRQYQRRAIQSRV